MPTRQKIGLYAFTVVVFIWCSIMPFVHANSLASRIGAPTLELLQLYTPEVVTSVLFALVAPFALKPTKASSIALIGIATILPILKFLLVSVSNVWPVSVIMLLALSRQFYKASQKNGSISLPT